MRTNLKFIGAILFTILFFVGGFFMNTAKGEAASTVQSLGVSYSLSSPVSNINNNGSISTMVLVGCAPQSGDLYDVNTGRPCTNNVKTALIGCAASSGDIFDVNTGIRCSSYIKPVLLGCALKSGDNYDINKGNRCGTTLVTIVTPPNPTPISKINSIDPISKTAISYNPVEISPISNNTINTISTEGNQSNLSGREQLKDSLTAGAAKVGSIFNGPMSIWIILLIILILLGGGYGIYSLGFLKKDKKWEVKDEGKKVVTEPVVKHNPATPATPHNNPQTHNPQNPQGNPQASLLNNAGNPIPPTTPQNPSF